MNRTVTTSWWRLVATVAVVVAAWGLCAEPAVFGHQRLNIGGVVGGLVGALWGSRYQNGAFWALARPERQRVVDAERSGTPTWDARLDTVVSERLHRAADKVRANRIVLVLAAVVALVVPVLAAARTGSWWYLLCLVPLSVPALVAVRELGLDDPRVRLARFRAATNA